MSSHSPAGDRIYLQYLASQQLSAEQEQQELKAGLCQTPKRIASKYFYDTQGSLLFEQICQLPEYYLTRTETEILQNSAQAIAQITGKCQMVELGSGSATKTRILLNAYSHQPANPQFTYVPIDISGSMLTASAEELVQEYANLYIHGLVSDYEVGLQHLPPTHNRPRIICFLGSTLGNLSPEDCDLFFNRIGQSMAGGDYFLLGIDCHKPPEIITAAYNDTQQVTAEFNRNILRHLNSRFGTNFAPELFKHQAIYNLECQQIEMYLSSQTNQVITLPWTDEQVLVEVGEAILTEISRKFSPMDIKQQLKAKGLELSASFSDRQNWYALLLFHKP